MMLRVPLPGVLAVVLCAAPLFGDWVLTQTAGGRTSVVYLSSAGYRQSVGQMDTVWNFKDNALYFVNRGTRQYSRVNADAFLDQMEHMFREMQAKAPKAAEQAAYRKTGTGTVAGLPCDRFEKTAGGRTTAMCVSTAISVPPQFAEKVKRLMTAINHANDPQAAMQGIPLRVTETAAGQQTVRMDTVKAEQKILPASEFDIPAGYTETPGPAASGR